MLMHLVKYCMTRQHGMNYSIVFSAILSVYLSTFLAGYGTGFSAVAVPGIQEEMR